MTAIAETGFRTGIVPDPYYTQVLPGCNGSCLYIPDTTYKNVVSAICGSIPSIADTDIRNQVSGFCSTLSHGLMGLQPGIDVDPMYSEILDDEAYFEWIFDNFRFGFSFLHEPADSYWFLVARDPTEGSTRFEGDFKAGYLPAVMYALSYIGSNA